MSFLRATISGLAGAVALTASHELLRRFVPDAPRLEVLGMEGIEKIFAKLGMTAPDGKKLFGSALVGDIVANSLFYSQVGTRGGTPLLRGVTLGVTAGLGAVNLPGKMGMSEDATKHTPQTALMTVALYTVGGIAAAIVASMMDDS